MTTRVTVHANHGWPVDVYSLPANPEAKGGVSRVPPGTSLDFYVHSGLDLRIHEVQPSELAAEVGQ